jgi:hypothetical protein
MKSLRGVVFVGVVAASGWTAGSCTPSRSDCADGVDNDGDGRVDGADPGCDYSGTLEAPDPPKCSDGADNDGDGLTDSADPGCGPGAPGNEIDPVRACNNGLDDDGDRLLDSFDPGCENSLDNDEYNPAACGDGVDNDGDGKSDYPNESGCVAADDPDETDPVPAAQCADGLDNDGDGATDWPADTGCAAAGDADEFNVVVGECGPGVPVTEITGIWSGTGQLMTSKPSEIESPTCAGLGGEAVFKFTLSAPGALEISTDYPETTLDTVIYLRSDCDEEASELACDDDGGDLGAGKASKMFVQDVAAGTYYVVVDAYGQQSIGAFKLTVAVMIPEGAACDPAGPPCGNDLVCREVAPGGGTVCAKHVCGDGADNDGDGKSDYPNEPGCTGPNDDTEDDGTPLPQCGDGLDNDGDGAIDYPMDDACESASANNEDCTTVGSDAAGYKLCKSTSSAPRCEDVVADGGGTAVCSGDDCTATITLPFPFTWYGTATTSLGVAANGYLGFPGGGGFSNSCSVLANTIAVMWDDLDPGRHGGQLVYKLYGTAPTRHVTVQWKIAHHLNGGETADFRAVVYEGTNKVDLCYVDTNFGHVASNGGASATIGFKGPMGASTGVNFSCNMAGVADGTFLRISPPMP